MQNRYYNLLYMNTQQIRYMEAISSTCHKQGMKASRLVSRAVELVKAEQKAIMSLPMDEQEREVGQSAPSAQ